MSHFRLVRSAAIGLLLLLPGLAGATPGTPDTLPPRWTGLDLTLVEDLKPARADGYTSGFTADFNGGLVRAYVMPSEQAASWWVARMANVVEKQKPTEVPLPLPLAPGAPPPEPEPPRLGADGLPLPPARLDSAQELLATGDKLVIARVDNVAVMVEVSRGARERAESVLATLTDLGEPWPTVPALERTGSGWVVQASPDLLVRYEGGTLASGPGLRFSTPPTALVVYDTLGRASRQAYDPLGLPVDAQPPWLDHEPHARTHPTPDPQ